MGLRLRKQRLLLLKHEDELASWYLKCERVVVRLGGKGNGEERKREGEDV